MAGEKGARDRVLHFAPASVFIAEGGGTERCPSSNNFSLKTIVSFFLSKVKFLRPADERGSGGGGGVDDDRDEEKKWFNIFTLHQNRDLGRGSKNCVHESMIPEWMDLVVWGHEHECLINPSESLVGTFRIVQPGSSVATSLTAGESRRKQVGLLEIKGQQFRLRPVTLTCVRGFAVGDVNLAERAREHGGVLDVEDPKVEERMMEVLATEVEALVSERAEAGWCPF